MNLLITNCILSVEVMICSNQDINTALKRGENTQPLVKDGHSIDNGWTQSENKPKLKTQ